MTDHAKQLQELVDRLKAERHAIEQAERQRAHDEMVARVLAMPVIKFMRYRWRVFRVRLGTWISRVGPWP